ncbi:hypothetical protein [Bordetella pseudohinzii]|uniref:hypothetical protein n=1 Tax=Bordetella pseudohinzii TaxID=1331258 RepID=UPI00103B9F1A|nr:hypothetical protein [Bordetella pseudohinzii]
MTDILDSLMTESEAWPGPQDVARRLLRGRASKYQQVLIGAAILLLMNRLVAGMLGKNQGIGRARRVLSLLRTGLFGNPGFGGHMMSEAGRRCLRK